MKTRVLQVDPQQPSADALEEAAEVLCRRGLVAFATETVYGLAALATDPAAVDRIYQAKGRPDFNPLIIHLDGISQARQCTTSWPEVGRSPCRHVLAGPFHLWFSTDRTLIPDVVTAGRDTVALRVPLPLVARRIDCTSGPTSCGPQRQSLEPAFSDPGRARLVRSGWQNRADPG